MVAHFAEKRKSFSLPRGHIVCQTQGSGGEEHGTRGTAALPAANGAQAAGAHDCADAADFAAGALTLSRNAASHLTAETIAQPTATPIAAAYDQTVVSREITLAAETWYAIQTGVFSNEDAAREKAELLTDRGAPGAVVEDGEKWRVFIACYGTETDAASVRQRLGENQRIETYLYRWTCPELQLRLKGMAGQVDVAEAGFTLLLQAARTLRDTASLLDAGELTLTEAQEQITALDGQLTLWRQTAQERFGRNPPSPIKELLALSDAWAQIRGNLENQDSKTALSAQLKLEGIGLFGRMIALRQGMGA